MRLRVFVWSVRSKGRSAEFGISSVSINIGRTGGGERSFVRSWMSNKRFRRGVVLLNMREEERFFWIILDKVISMSVKSGTIL